MLVAINALLIAKTRDFLGPYLVGAKPAIRALLKAANLCAKEPEAGARMLEQRGFEPRYDVIVKMLEASSIGTGATPILKTRYIS